MGELSSIETATALIRGFASNLPGTPGVYRMLGDKDRVLYVGKAKNLKKRVLSYTAISRLPIRIQRMVALTRSMEFVHTHTEAEALLLESNLIKKLKPHYNVLMRDDKSFPYILLTAGHDFPQVLKHRGARSKKGEYFGPFANVYDVNNTIAILQRAFMLRNCTDSYFAQRKRPCLQYHIKRCTAPCVGLVSKEDYAKQIDNAHDFLKGKSRAVQTRMEREMEKASAVQDYETAASYRDRIRALTSIQARQDINVAGVKDADVFALAQKNGKSCVQVFFFRAGQNYGNRAYFPVHQPDEAAETILSAFMAQFYGNKPVPKEAIVSHDVDDKKLLEEVLKFKIVLPARGARGRLLDFVAKNAAVALDRHLAESATERSALEKVAKLLDMDDAPRRIDVFDNSHISGTNMVGAMIVAGTEGFHKNSYRKFNIKIADKSDDVGMMREVLSRRFKAGANADDLPDLVIVDGGQGQFNAAREVLQDLGLHTMKLVAIAKGPDRNAGREQFFTQDRHFTLPPNDPAMHYFQRLRDEAHRFAISAHRARRAKESVRSAIDDIPGIGANRKKALLHHFGSGKAVADAGVEDLRKVSGISKSVAQRIYDHFH